MLSETDLLERLLDAVPSPVVVADLKGRVLVFNPAAESALGYGASEARRHLHVTDLYYRADDARRVLRRLRERAEAGPGTDDGGIEVTLRARNGELIPVRLTAALVRDASGNQVGTVGVFQDLREHIALGKRLEDAAGQVEASERRAAGALALSQAAHEMAQPLTAALGNVEMMLLDRNLPPNLRDRLQRTLDQLDRLRHIVNDVSRRPPAAGGGA